MIVDDRDSHVDPRVSTSPAALGKKCPSPSLLSALPLPPPSDRRVTVSCSVKKGRSRAHRTRWRGGISNPGNLACFRSRCRATRCRRHGFRLWSSASPRDAARPRGLLTDLPLAVRSSRRRDGYHVVFSVARAIASRGGERVSLVAP